MNEAIETPEAIRLLAEKIAREVFASGDEPRGGGKVHRIQFMGGWYPNGEIPLGGFCEIALASCIELALKKHMTPNKE